MAQALTEMSFNKGDVILQQGHMAESLEVFCAELCDGTETNARIEC